MTNLRLKSYNESQKDDFFSILSAFSNNITINRGKCL